MMNLTIDQCCLPEKLELEDKWILSKLNTAVREITENMERYELGVAARRSMTSSGMTTVTGISS